MTAARTAAGSPGGSRGTGLPDGFWYTAKRRLLGPPLVNEQLRTERLSRPLALGILSCDGISSAAYGTEMMLLELLPLFGLAAFTLILPLAAACRGSRLALGPSPSGPLTPVLSPSAPSTSWPGRSPTAVRR